MTELKTLKDIKSYTVSPIATGILDEKNSDWRWITDVDLRQEAIKWVKHFNSKDYGIILTRHNMPMFDEMQSKIFMQVLDNDTKLQLTRQFMKFFNLTEEDLK